MGKTLSTIGILALAAMTLASCLLTGNAAAERTVTLPEPPEEAARKIIAYEKSGNYLYSFMAMNWGDVLCEFKIYDDQYMRIYYPQTDMRRYYYYRLYGDYLEHGERKGVFGQAIGIDHSEVSEILFRNRFFGAYKFKSQHDQMVNDRRYAQGYITWNTYPAARQPGTAHFLEYFLPMDRELRSSTDEVGNKRDIAGILYYALSEKAGFTVTWDGQDTDANSAEKHETHGGNEQ